MKFSVYDYTDYRLYLSDFIAAQKARNPNYSLSVFCRGITGLTKTSLSNIINSRRNMSAKISAMVARALSLKDRETNYFETLVRFNQASKQEEKEIYLAKLVQIRPKNLKDNLDFEQYLILRNWHCGIVRELIAFPDFNEDPLYISRKLNGHLKPSQAKGALNRLINAKLLSRKKNNKLVMENKKTLRTTDEVASITIRKFHSSCLDLGQEILRNAPIDQREYGSITMVLSQEDFIQMKERLKMFRDEIMPLGKEAAEKRDAKLCQLNFQFFCLNY